LKVRKLGAVVAIIALWGLATAATAWAYYQRYVSDAVFNAGSSAGSAFNRLTYNAVTWSPLANHPTVYTTYARTDGSEYVPLASTSGSIFDSRSVAYGSARCGVTRDSPYGVFIDFCDTGNT
jgi:hypothetical protein